MKQQDMDQLAGNFEANYAKLLKNRKTMLSACLQIVNLCEDLHAAGAPGSLLFALFEKGCDILDHTVLEDKMARMLTLYLTQGQSHAEIMRNEERTILEGLYGLVEGLPSLKEMGDKATMDKTVMERQNTLRAQHRAILASRAERDKRADVHVL